MPNFPSKSEATEANRSDDLIEPLAHELIPAPQVIDAFRSFKHQPGCLLLDSSMQITSAEDKPLGRYSFLMADPFDWLECEIGTAQPLEPVRDVLAKFRLRPIPDLPPFQGGLAGLLSYDLNQSFESVGGTQTGEFKLPALALGCYDAVMAWDHEQGRAWIISSGAPESSVDARANRAAARIQQIVGWLEGEGVSPNLTLPLNNSDSDNSVSDKSAAKNSPPIQLGKQFPVDGPEGLSSNFSPEGYQSAIQKCIDYIYAGDAFQINLSQRLLFPANCHAATLYERLRRCNPAPFSGYFDLGSMGESDAQIVSASPERFFAVRDRIVETRPIKGTRRRTGTPMVDIHNRKQLVASEKDRSENTMIVDLMRNDLSRCCTDESIEVTQLCELEEYQSVLHLVSAVQGRLTPETDLVDLIESIFPGGSITGAPKVRAMEIIAELEPNSRGAYCGALGYLGFDGTADFNILIRTITASGGWWQIPVGGGIVSQSDPAREYEETWTKAAGMLRAVTE